jgi:tungstate transport system ATP-binding protein
MLDNAIMKPAPEIADAGAAHGVLPLRFDSVTYDAGTNRILADVSLALEAGGPTVLMGPNGSGKTTLIKLAMGLIVPAAGSITFGGSAAPPRGSRALVFQKPVMLKRTVAANIAYALDAAGKPSGERALQRLLELAHIAPLAERPARRLSGGEQQRLALTRALAREPQILFLDEPTASLDPSSTKLVEEIIARVSASGVKILMSTHDLGQARRLAHEVVFMTQGRIVEHTAAAIFFSQPASEAARRFLAGDLVI